MASTERCEWCGIKLRGEIYYFNLPSGKYGYFCSNRCLHEANEADCYGTKHGMCFISTAVYLSLGKNDNCYELELLRDFRDTYMLGDKDFSHDVDYYYKVSPLILEKIFEKDNSVDILNSIYESYLSKAINSIENGDLDKAYMIYKEMVLNYKNEFF